jgi:site-specific DNA-cytosine methylase
MDVLQELHGEDDKACVFDDLVLLGQNRATCRHSSEGQGPCAIPAIDWLVAGFSCKDFSKANPNRNKFQASRILSTAASPGKSADTFLGTLRVIDQKMPEVVFLENVDLDQDEERSLALDQILHELATRGYDTQAYLMNASDYGLPQSRRRLFIIAMIRPGRKLKVKNFQSYWIRFHELLKGFKMSGPNFMDALLPESNTVVQKELKSRLASQAKGWDSSTIKIHRQEWTRAGLRWQASSSFAPALDRESDWFATLPARARDVLGYTVCTHKDKGKDDQGLFGVDVSQSIGRAPTSQILDGRVLVPTILPNTHLWVLPRHRLVTPAENLAFQVSSGCRERHFRNPLASSLSS